MTDRAQPTGTVGRRSGAFLISRLVGSAGFFFAVVILARGLEPTGRGAVAFLTVTALTVSAVVRLGVGDATIVFAARPEHMRRTLFSNLMLWTALSATVGGCAVAAMLFAVGDRRPVGIGMVEILMVAIGTVMSAFVEAGYTMLLVSARIRQQATITATGPWLYALLLLFISVLGGLTITTAAFAWVASQGLWAAATVSVGVVGIGLGRFDGELMRRAVAFGAQAWIGNMANFLNSRLDQLILGLLSSTQALGAYAVAVNAAEIVLYVPTASAQALLSAVARDDPDLRTTRVTRTFRAALLTTVAMCVAAALAGPSLLPLIFGQTYAVSVVPFLLLLPGGIGFTALMILSSGLLLSAAPRLASVGPAVSLISGAALDLVLIPRFDVGGAAFAATAALLAGGVTAALAFRIRTHVSLSSLVPRAADAALLVLFAGSVGRGLFRRVAK